MKHLSIRLKITAWFSAALIITAMLTYFSVLAVGRQIIQKTIKDNLIETVENNIDEVEYHKKVPPDEADNDADYFMDYEGGWLEIDDDFLKEVNGVYTALYAPDFSLIYGENPIAKATENIGFTDSQLSAFTVNGVIWYVYERELSEQGLDGLRLRGVVSERQGKEQLDDIAVFSLIILPIVVAAAVIGGYIIAGRALRPVREITRTADKIAGGNDLHQRIGLSGSDDELHRLADTFDRMLERLEGSFSRERRFISDVSHEMRTPLSVITSQCELSLMNGNADKDALLTIKRQTDTMSRLVNNMLTFSRLEADAQYYKKEALDLSGLFASICGDMALIREKNISLSSDISDGIELFGNSELLTRLLSNLISNAYRYGKENGNIFISLSENNGTVILNVSDDGIGISEDDIPKIFDRFYRADKSRSSEGMGLGLSMADEIAKYHGGSISVESNVNEGSRFQIIFIKS